MLNKNRLFCISQVIAILIVIAGCGERDPQKLLESAAAAEKENRTAEAMEFAEKSVKYNPQDVDSLLFYAALLEKSGDYEKALPNAELAVKLAPERFEAHHLAGKILLKMPGRHPEAIAPLLRAKGIEAGDLDNLLLLATSYAQAGNYKELLKALKEASVIPGCFKRAEYHNLVGMYYFHYKLYDRAVKNFLQAYRFDRKSPEIIYNIACAQEKRGNAAGAKQFYQLYLRSAGDRNDQNQTIIDVRAKLAKLK